MPLTPLQKDILKVIASHRDTASYVAGGTVIQRSGIRRSDDIDIFHDTLDGVAVAADRDLDALHQAGFTIQITRRVEGMISVNVLREEEGTRLEWVHDSDFRFFPAVPDAEFGFALHPIDLATNKILAAANRREVRDAIDLIWIDEHVQQLGAIAWAAVDKDPGWMPDGLLSNLLWRARYRDDEMEPEKLLTPLTAGELNNSIRALVAKAERLIAAMPRHLEYGALLGPDGRLARPDPDDPASFDGITVHHGSRKGAWPSSPEIASVMLRERPLP